MNSLTDKAIEIYKTDGIKPLMKKSQRFISFKISDTYRRTIFKLKKQYIIKEIQGSIMRLNTHDYGISMDLYFDKIREKDSTKYMQTLMVKGQTIIDIGANIGYYALQESKAVGTNGTVYAIEPNIDSLNELKINTILNNYDNIKFYNLAIGDKTKMVTLFIAEESNLTSLFNYGTVIDKKKIRMVTLDEFIKDKKSPDIIRMDVEGAEYEIIKGMKETLALNKNLIIFMELHTGTLSIPKVKYVLQVLMDNGFKVKRLIKEYPVRKYKRELTKQLTIDDMLSSDEFLKGSYGATHVTHIFFEKR